MRAGALLAGLLALAGCATEAGPPTGSGAVGDCIVPAGWGTPDPAAAARVLDLVNAHRASRGLAPLRPDPRLEAAATWKARHMARNRYLSHDDPAPPLSRPFAARLAACGVPGAAVAENIAVGEPTPDAVMRLWLGSSAHRRNIEGPAYTHVGVAAARASNGRIYWAQVFARIDG